MSDTSGGRVVSMDQFRGYTVAGMFLVQSGKRAEPLVAEKMRILAWLGTDAGKFRSHDGQTHESATAMGDAAKRGDGLAVISAFSKVQQSFLICHQSFRKPFLEHFYENR